ncbi:hypothetical protein D3C74_57040 [compost metagenome]
MIYNAQTGYVFFSSFSGGKLTFSRGEIVRSSIKSLFIIGTGTVSIYLFKMLYKYGEVEKEFDLSMKEVNDLET